MMRIEKSWHAALCEELQKPYIRNLKEFISAERAGPVPIYPPEEDVFSALYFTPIDRVRVVIVGQDPYHGPGQAQGLCFSVPAGVSLPPSLKNIYKELVDDVGIAYPKHGSLIPWAQQGVLLLNATLTVRQGQPGSHYGHGWEQLTDAIVAEVCRRDQPVVFLLWGKFAQEKVRNVMQVVPEAKRHSVLVAPHPSPFSAHQGFFGCRHFSKTNSLLEEWGKEPIRWDLNAFQGALPHAVAG